MGVFGRKSTDGERAEELFSPYLDGQVSPQERMFLERYLAEHPETRAKFELAKQAVQLTQTLPPVKPPRSFVLPRSMARKPSPAMRLYPVMRLATVAAMALFVFALVGDLATSSRLAPTAETQSVALSIQPTESPDTAAPEALLSEAPAPTATLEAAGAARSDAAATATVPAAADAAAPAVTATPAATQDAAKMLAVTAESSESFADTSVAGQPSAAPDSVDVLRTSVFALAGLTLVLAAATLVVRQRAR